MGELKGIIPSSQEPEQIDQLHNAQEFAAHRAPEDAADTFNYAKNAGVTFEQAETQKKTLPLPAPTWGALVKDHPVLSKYLSDPGFAAAAQDDVKHLSTFEKLFGGWDEMAWKSKQALEGDQRNQELSAIGRAQRYGTATKEQLARADELEKSAQSGAAGEIGFVPGIVPSVVGALPGLSRALPTAAWYGVGGAIGGLLLTKNPKAAIAAGGAMAGAGFVAGMSLDTAKTEQGLSYREYTKMGADPASAAVASDIVALANGGLQAIPAEKVLNIVPGLRAILQGKATRDIMRRLIGSNTGKAVLARFAGRVAESGLLMALIGSGQELVKEVGAMASGADDRPHGDKLLSAGTSGLQQGLGFGIGHAVLPAIAEKREADLGQARSEMFKAIGGIATESKLRERMPAEFKKFANDVINEHGKVNEVKVPAEKLASLFQREGVDPSTIQEQMPELAKQLRESKPTDEIVVPTADLATHIAHLKGFGELIPDLRIGDDLTINEAKEAQKEGARIAAEKPTEQEAPTPERRVYEDVFKKLTDAGHSPDVAQHDAALWAAFSKTRGERTGVDPFDYYNKRVLSIDAELQGRGEISLGQKPEEYGGTHRPPGPGRGAPLHDLTGRGEVYPDDVYSADAARLYGTGESKMDRETMEKLQGLRGKPDAEVTVYRAVPKSTKDAEINRGDWITVNKEYAEQHGARFEEGAKIISKMVRAQDVWTNGDSIHEGGYFPSTLNDIADRIEEFGPALKKQLVGGADVPDELLSTFLQAEKDRKPGKIPTEQEINEAIERAKAFVKETDLFQPAYHGTPHNFDKFTLDHIGTGEGAQSYGWGLYFAEAQSVARYYRNKLSHGAIFLEGEEPKTKVDSDIADTLRAAGLDNPLSFDAAKKKVLKSYEDRLQEQREIAANENHRYREGAKSAIADYETRIARLKEIKHASAAGSFRRNAFETSALLRERAEAEVKKIESSEEFKAHKKYEDEEIKYYDDLETDRKNAKKPSMPPAAFRYVGDGLLRYPLLKRLLKSLDYVDKSGSDAGFQLWQTIYKELGVEGEALNLSSRLKKYGEDLGIETGDLLNKKPGAVHEVELPEKENLLDYDKRLDQQNPAVLKKLEDFGILPKGFAEITEKYNNMEPGAERTKLIQDAGLAGGVKLPNGERVSWGLGTRDGGETLYRALMETLIHPKTGERIPGGQESASKLLLEAGIPGLMYLDQGSRTGGEGTHNFVIWDEEAIKTLKVLEQQTGAAGEGDYRGKVSFDKARSFFRMTLTGKANLSTFLHESGHAFLEFLRADAEGGHEGSKAELAKVFEWWGLKPGEEPSVKQLEEFARGFESYLMEGKAPAAGLREAFGAFKSWLKLVYKSISSLGVNLSDDIRGVMDRMLATDGEIEEARQNIGFEPMAKPKEMSEGDYTAYKKRFAEAVQKSRDELEAQALKEFSKTIGDERRKVQGEVEEKIKHDPIHNAYEALRSGKRLDGVEVPEEIRGKKLSREAVHDFPGFEDNKKWNSITSPDGLDPEIAAPYYGFKSGQEMLEKIAALKSRSREIKEETDARMKERYPDAEMGKMAEQAIKAVHNEDVTDVLWKEAETTAKYLTGLEAQSKKDRADPRFQKAVIKETARRRTESMTMLEMTPGRFARAEERAAMDSEKAFKAGKFEEAHAKKLEQIANHEMWKRVSDAKDEINSIRDYLAKFDDLSVRRRMGKAGQMYLNAIDKLLEDVDLKKVSNADLARRASLESYLREIEEEGGTITIPNELRSEAGLKNFKTMMLEDLRAVHDAVANVETMARLKNKLFDGRQKRNFHETAVKLSEHIKSNLGTPFAEKPGAPQNPGWWENKKHAFRETRAEKKILEFVARELDGGKTAGWAHELLIQPIKDAEDRAWKMAQEITEKLFKPLREMSIKEKLALDKTVDFLGTPMRLRDVIAVALNMGNDGNKRKLLEGYAYRGWTEDGVTQRLGELLTDKHLDLVEHFWKTIGSLWPEIKALSERATGVSPPKVEPTKLMIRGRELEGGYYPVVYDRTRNYKAEQIAQRKGDLFQNNFLLPSVSKGFTESRTKFSAPIQLTLGVIPAHINEVIHYLTHYEPLRAIDRLTAHNDVRTAITEGLGREIYNEFRPWLQRIAHNGSMGMEHLTTVDSFLRRLRIGNTLNRFGFKVTTAIMQGFNLLSTFDEIGMANTALGFKRWLQDIESFKDPFGAVYDQSKEMRGKSVRMERELMENFDHFTSAFSELGHLKEQFGHFAMSFFSLIIRTTDTITWYGAREKALAENHPRPEDYADSAVRMSQMGENVSDKARIMFGGEGTKLFTGMYSWYNVVFNRIHETMPAGTSTPKKIAEYAARYWWLVVSPSVLMNLMRGRGPKTGKDDPDKIAQFYAEEIAMEGLKMFPVAGTIAETLLTEHEARWGTWISTMYKGVVARAKLARGETLSEHEKQSMAKSTGIMSKMPADALYNAYKYVSAVQDGKLEEPIADLLFRSPGEWK